MEPAHGGTVVLAGAQPVEVVPHASGEVHAYVVGAPPPAGAELAVTVPVREGVRTVELEWNPTTVRFEGRVRRVEVVPGPVDVVYVTGGTRWVGHAPTVIVSPAVVVAPAAIEVEVDAPREVVVVPPSPRVIVTPPSPRVVFTPPRPHVVITQPAVQLEVRGKHRKHRKHRGRGHGRGHGGHGRADVRVRIR